MKFNRTVFFSDYRGRFGTISNQKVVDGINFLLDQIATDTKFTMIREVAYLFATVMAETGIFQPIQEKRWNKANHPIDWAKQNVYWQTGFYGRGYVQITWKTNYLKAGTKLAGLQLKTNDGTQITINANSFVNNPELVLQQHAAYLIASRGMHEGWFTGKKFSDYIKQGQTPDYVGARKIINGINRNVEIAGYASKFELILRASLIQ